MADGRSWYRIVHLSPALGSDLKTVVVGRTELSRRVTLATASCLDNLWRRSRSMKRFSTWLIGTRVCDFGDASVRHRLYESGFRFDAFIRDLARFLAGMIYKWVLLFPRF